MGPMTTTRRCAAVSFGAWPVALSLLCAGCAATRPDAMGPRGAGAPQDAVAPMAQAPASAPTRATAERPPEAISLLGVPLRALPAGARPEAEAALEEARRRLAERPDDPARIVWVGRRLGYLWRMREAVEVYSRGIAEHPRYVPLYRHRGHRYISLRQFDLAIADLERAAELLREMPDEVEPDGQPNARNVPLTTTGFNVWYHLGLARYLKGELAGALDAFERADGAGRGLDDNRVATTYWRCLILRALGRGEEAARLLEPVSADMDIIENHAYHRLLLHYRLDLSEHELLDDDRRGALDAATIGYGVGKWRLLNGQEEAGLALLGQVLDGGEWPAFGYIAAEVELARRSR